MLARAVAGIPAPQREGSPIEALAELSEFRQQVYECPTARADELFELAEAVLCAEGPVKTLVGLSLAPEHRRGHGALYDAINHGRIEISRLRHALAGIELPRAAGGRIVLGVDIFPWLRPGAPTSPERLFCHTYGRGKDKHQMIPGWPYSVIAALESGRTSWTAVLDALRLQPGDDEAAITAAQVRDLVSRMLEAGHWQPGDPDILIAFDAGYDLPRLAFLLADLPVEVLGRLRSDRVLLRPAPPRGPQQIGRPSKHGGEFRLKDEATWHPPEHTTSTDTTHYGTTHYGTTHYGTTHYGTTHYGTTHYGTTTARCWDRLHHRLGRRSAWINHDGDLPVVEGTLIHLQVDHLPGERDPKPLWLWSSAVGISSAHLSQLWQAFLRRFDLEHTFRLFKQTLGWTVPKIRAPRSADLWTWLIIIAHTQLRLARPLAADLRRPWERPAPPERPSPARIRRGFRHIRPAIAHPAGAPKPSTPGPGRPPGSKNRVSARHHDVGKTVKRDTSPTARQRQAGWISS
ncbi:transposase [Nonomuraea sp. WAC 01424]|nr:transposase [Nonomuraea sp. WAC 01424]